jgi:hypothetical protein
MLLALVLLAACGGQSPAPTPTPVPAATSTTAPAPGSYPGPNSTQSEQQRGNAVPAAPNGVEINPLTFAEEYQGAEFIGNGIFRILPGGFVRYGTVMINSHIEAGELVAVNVGNMLALTNGYGGPRGFMEVTIVEEGSAPSVFISWDIIKTDAGPVRGPYIRAIVPVGDAASMTRVAAVAIARSAQPFVPNSEIAIGIGQRIMPVFIENNEYLLVPVDDQNNRQERSAYDMPEMNEPLDPTEGELPETQNPAPLNPLPQFEGAEMVG